MDRDPGALITLILRAGGGDLKRSDDFKSLSSRFKMKNKNQFARFVS